MENEFNTDPRKDEDYKEQEVVQPLPQEVVDDPVTQEEEVAGTVPQMVEEAVAYENEAIAEEPIASESVTPSEETVAEEQPTQEAQNTASQQTQTEQPKQPYYYTDRVYRYEPQQPKQPVQEPKKKKGSTGGKVVLCIFLAVIFGVVACSAYKVTDYVWSSMFGQRTSVSPAGDGENTKLNTTTTSSDNKTTIDSDVADVAEAVMPSIVSVQNISVQQVQDWFYGTREYEQTSSGTGIVIGQNEEELLIVTNNHVVADSKTLTVTFSDESSVEALIKGADSKYDVAIVSVSMKELKEETKNTIKIATLGDSDALRAGEPTIAIGNALGYGQSVTCGIVSALGREIEGYDAKFIQTDAAINPGNSGGALLNAKGEVIGINTAKVSDSSVEGIGYAIPISDIKDMLDNLMNRKTRTKVEEAKRGYLGITGQTVDSDSAAAYGIPEGIFISEVMEGGAAETAGLSRGSIITKLDGSSVETIEGLKAELEYYAIGEEVTLTVLVPQTNGDYKETNVNVVLQKQVSE